MKFRNEIVQSYVEDLLKLERERTTEKVLNELLKLHLESGEHIEDIIIQKEMIENG